MEVRNDFKDVESFLYKFLNFSNSFIGFDSDWVHFKNREDFERVYTLPNDVKSSFERIYSDGRDMAFYMGDQLKEFNDFTKYPSLPSFVNSFKNTWVYHIEELKEASQIAKKYLETPSNALWSVRRMVHLFDRQINLLEEINKILISLKHTNLYKFENNGYLVHQADEQEESMSVLMLISNPLDNFLNIDKEMKMIQSKIQSSPNRERFKINYSFYTQPQDLLQVINTFKPNILHFSGHGAEDGSLILISNKEDAIKFSVEKLKLVINCFPNIHLVLLNSCYSSKIAQDIADICGFCIGMNDPISDDGAITFASHFYSSLGFGNSLSDSFNQGLTSLTIEGLYSDKPQIFQKQGCDAQSFYITK